MPSAAQSVAGLVRFSDTEAAVDSELLRGGKPHRKDLARRHRIHDGVVVVSTEISGEIIYAQRSGYFAMLATSDALRAEFMSGRPERPLRARAHVLAGDPGPLISGRGRAAAVGVSVVVTVRGRRNRGFLLGRRRLDLAMDGNEWQLAPSGMVEPANPGDVIVESVRRELAEELSIAVGTAELTERLRPLGLAIDLLRLRPEVCVRFDAADEEIDTLSLELAADEFNTARVVGMSPQDMNSVWSELGPPNLTPAAAGAMALLEHSEGFDMATGPTSRG